MIRKHYTDALEEVVTKANATKTTIRWLVTKEEGSERYATRRFEIKPGGQIGVHAHPEEHHIYILEGSCILINEKGEKIIAKPGDVFFIPSNEPHGYANEGDKIVAFLCVIPYL
ncbi:MAG: cupin domain-containing protein [Candidatus Lokiarchaeota archaeon]|nr:cupin domain-containing protein [Candidatus Lokiarchaeota archaeon]